jgi:hypothetical protein
MSDFEPRFEARPASPLDDGWCVHIFWDAKKPNVIPGFSNQYEALDWIKSKSANWVADYII